MDIQSASAAANQPVYTSGSAEALESAAEERKEVNDSSIERKEVERSSTGPNVGNKIDIST